MVQGKISMKWMKEPNTCIVKGNGTKEPVTWNDIMDLWNGTVTIWPMSSQDLKPAWKLS